MTTPLRRGPQHAIPHPKTAVMAPRLSQTKSRCRDRPSAAPESAGAPPARERNCSVARTLDIVSDAWAFLIIREAFFGTRTFEAFRSALGIPRATLTDRLRKLTQLADLPSGRDRYLATQGVPTYQNGV